MSAASRCALLVAGALAIAASPAAPSARAAGEESDALVVGRVDPATGETPRVEVRVRWGPSVEGSTGWSFARVDVQNRDRRPHTVSLVLGRQNDSTDAVRASRSVRLEAGASTTTWLPRLETESNMLQVASEGARTQMFASDRSNSALTVVCVPTAMDANGRLEAAVRSELSIPVGSGAPALCTIEGVAVDDLPPAWTYLTAAAAVVVDGRARGLDVERQRVLVEYVRAGGTLALLGRDDLPKGPLLDLTGTKPAAGLGGGSLGLGRWFAFPRSGGSAAVLTAESAAPLARAILRGRASPTSSPRTEASRASAVIPYEFGIAQAIPGLARVPARLFFFLLLGFAIFVGPVAYLWLKRRRRLTAMLLVVPATGLSFSALILGYGLVVEGLGTRGAVSTFTVLDQREHAATCVADRTLFSGWSPSSLSVSPDTALYVPDLAAADPYSRYYREYAASARTRLDLDVAASRVDGSLVPSRTVVTLASLTSGRARERLRFRRREALQGGGFDVLAAEGFAPLDAQGSMLLRAADGRHYVSRGATRLEPVDDAGADAALTSLRATITTVESSDEEDPSVDPWRRYTRSTRWISGLGMVERPNPGDRTRFADRALPAAPDEMPRGSYVALTTRAPGFDDLGIQVEWKGERHLVVGLLAPDDVEEGGK